MLMHTQKSSSVILKVERLDRPTTLTFIIWIKKERAASQLTCDPGHLPMSNSLSENEISTSVNFLPLPIHLLWQGSFSQQ